MKFGFRTPSFKRSLSAATKGAAKRALMREIVPYYGKRGMGWSNPKKAAYNRVYNMATTSPIDILTDKPKTRRNAVEDVSNPAYGSIPTKNSPKKKKLKVWQRVLLGIGLVIGGVAAVFVVLKLIEAIFPLFIGLIILLSFLFNGK